MSYINSLREAGKTAIILDAGDALFSKAKYAEHVLPAEKYKAKSLLRGYEKIGCDAINVGGFEFSAGYAFLKSLKDSTSIPLISANLIDTQSGALAFSPYLIIENEQFKVGIIGVTNLLPDHVKELKMKDYLTTGQSTIRELEDRVDVLVMLVNANRTEYKLVKKAFKAADYIFVSRGTSRTRPEQAQASEPPYLYSSAKQGKYLSVIDLTIVNLDSPFIDVSYSKTRLKNVRKRFENLQKRDPNKTLEEIYADQPNVLRLIKDYKNQQLKAEQTLASAINYSEFLSVPMGKKIKDDEKMLTFVNTVLEEAKSMRKISQQNYNKPKKTNTSKIPKGK